MDAMVGLLAESDVKLLQQGEILHCIERKAKIQPPFQLIGQRKQANAERFGMWGGRLQNRKRYNLPGGYRAP